MTETTVAVRPRAEGTRLGPRVGYPELVALAEQAVQEWFRERGWPPGRLARGPGLALQVIDASTLLPAGLDADDEVVAEAERVGGRFFDVRLAALRDGARTAVLRGRFGVALRSAGADLAGALPAELADLVLDRLDGLGTAVAGHDPRHEEAALAEAARVGVPGYHRQWRVPYPAGSAGGRLPLAGYVRALEETVDALLADGGVPAGRLYAERGWLPVITRSRLRLIGDVLVGDTLHCVLTVAQVVRGSLLDLRLDWHVERAGGAVPTATGIVLLGFADARTPGGAPVPLDEATVAAVTATAR